jgi:hypothetical protein
MLDLNFEALILGLLSPIYAILQLVFSIFGTTLPPLGS